MKKYTILIYLTILFSCSDAEKTTREKMNDAWQAFTDKNYELAINRFESLDNKEKVLLDYFLGTGWSHLLLNSDSIVDSIYANGSMHHPNNEDLFALKGFNELNKEKLEQSIEYFELTLQINSNYSFRYLENFNHNTIRLMVVQSSYLLGKMEDAVKQIKVLNDSFSVDLNSPDANGLIATEIERLMSIYIKNFIKTKVS